MMPFPGEQTRAILQAQFRTMANLYPRSGRGGLLFSILTGLVWYGLWVAIATGLAFALGSDRATPAIHRSFASGLLLVLLYWQLVPLVLVTAGLSLDLRRLRVYPVPDRQLFGIELLLRATTSAEMLLLLTGAAVGIARNAAFTAFDALFLLPYAAFNLLVSTGVKDMFTRALARKRLREIVILFCVSLGAAPQFLAVFGVPASVRAAFEMTNGIWSPWGAASLLVIGPRSWVALLSMIFWLAAGFWFARWQFQRSLYFDPDGAAASPKAPAWKAGIAERIFRLPGLFFRDPLAALVEKELRFLSRAPRFRLVFFMGFTFGLVLWLPLTLGRVGGDLATTRENTLAANFFTIVCIYALTLLGEVAFWNNLGFDRSAAQLYFLAPVPFSRVLLAKNIAALAFVALEIAMVMAMVWILRLPASWKQLPEAITTTGIFSIYLLAVGNLGSVYFARPVDPAQSWRGGSGNRFQALMLFIYPAASIPLVISFLIRKATGDETYFLISLMTAAALGLVCYWLSLKAASVAAHDRREEIAAVLSAGQAPIA